MKQWKLTKTQLKNLKQNNTNCAIPCYKCVFWNECWFNYERSGVNEIK